MKRIQPLCSLVCAFLMISSSAFGQSAVRIEPPSGGLGWLTRPYQQRYIPPINLNNSSRLASLIRGGNLYLTAKDVIALALENNLDIEIQRYGPLLAKQNPQRATAGVPLPTVGAAVAAGPQSVSLPGVTLTHSTTVSAAGAGVSSGCGIITQRGPTMPSFDPQISFYTNFGHQTIPESNTFLTGTSEFILNTRTVQAQYAQNFDWGMSAQLSYYSTHYNVNSFNYFLNPYDSGALDLYVTQNLLQGFGRAVNDRNITIGKNNEKVAMLQFEQQVITTVSAVLNLYWDLVSFEENVRAKKDELATAQQLYEDNKKQVQIGTLAPIEVTRAEAQVYSSQQDLLVAETNLSQQEVVLKNALSRNGVASPLLAEVHMIPLDTFSVPQKQEERPIEDLVQQALKNRVEIQQQKLNIDSDSINLNGIKNELKPTLQVFAQLTNNALAGTYNVLEPPVCNSPSAPEGCIPRIHALIGGHGSLLGQIFGRDYPRYSAGVSLSIPQRNRAAQADYASTALQKLQDEITLQKAINQVRVDVQNAVIGLRQARVRYDSAVKARILQQQTLDADKKKYTLGASTVFQVVTDEQTLAATESTETQALANYSHAQINFDQAMGTTMEVNHISYDEALSGRVARQSVLPAKLPNPEQVQ